MCACACVCVCVRVCVFCGSVCLCVKWVSGIPSVPYESALLPSGGERGDFTRWSKPLYTWSYPSRLRGGEVHLSIRDQGIMRWPCWHKSQVRSNWAKTPQGLNISSEGQNDPTPVLPSPPASPPPPPPLPTPPLDPYNAFEGLRAEECGILNGCENGRCVRVQEGYTCDCFDGYTLDMSRMACIGKPPH